MEYTADSIKILSEEEQQQFLFKHREALESKYPYISTVFIRRLLEAATTAGCDWEQVEAKYLAKTYGKAVDNQYELIECYQQIMKDERD